MFLVSVPFDFAVGLAAMFRRCAVWGLVILVGVTTGCGEGRQARPTRPSRPDSSEISPVEVSLADDPTAAAKADANETTSPVETVDLVEANWNELQSLIEQQQGKFVVVDIWSTACEPCMKEFPQLIALQQRFPDDLVAISFDIDFAGIKNKPPAFYRERVLRFLSSQIKNNVLHRMCNTPADDLFTEIKLDSIPAVFVYGRDGSLLKRFAGSTGEEEGVSYDKQVIPFVANLVQTAAVK